MAYRRASAMRRSSSDEDGNRRKEENLGWNLADYMNIWKTESTGNKAERLQAELDECRRKNDFLESELRKAKDWIIQKENIIERYEEEMKGKDKELVVAKNTIKKLESRTVANKASKNSKEKIEGPTHKSKLTKKSTNTTSTQTTRPTICTKSLEILNGMKEKLSEEKWKRRTALNDRVKEMKEANVRMERVMEKFKSHQDIIEKKDEEHQEKYLYIKSLLEKQRNSFEQKQFSSTPDPSKYP